MKPAWQRGGLCNSSEVGKLVNELVELFEIYKKAQLRNALPFAPSHIFTVYLLRSSPASNHIHLSSHLPEITSTSSHQHFRQRTSTSTPQWRPI